MRYLSREEIKNLSANELSELIHFMDVRKEQLKEETLLWLDTMRLILIELKIRETSQKNNKTFTPPPDNDDKTVH